MAKPKLSGVRKQFLDALNSSEMLFNSGRTFAKGSYQHPQGAIITRKQAERIVAYAFLSSVAAWEEFVVDVSLRYLRGVSAPSGFTPTLLNPPQRTLLEAAKCLSQKPYFDIEVHYITWKKLAIRNRVAHASKKCQSDFEKAVKAHRGLPATASLSQGADPGRLLLQKVTHVFSPNPSQTYFEAYLAWFRDMAKLLVP